MTPVTESPLAARWTDPETDPLGRETWELIAADGGFLARVRHLPNGRHWWCISGQSGTRDTLEQAKAAATAAIEEGR